MPPPPDERSAEKKAIDDAIAELAEITVTPEMWLKGVRVDAAEFGFPPYTVTKRTFANVAEARRAKADFDAMCAAGFAREKAYRMCLAETDPALDAARTELLKRLGL